MPTEPDLIVPALDREPWFKGSLRLLSQAAHVHNSEGKCLKNREGSLCDAQRLS